MPKAAKEETIKIDSSEITILPKEVEKKVNAEIGLIRVEANVTDEVIKTLKEEYGGLAIKDQTDKEGYLAVQEARKHVKKIRVAAGKLFDKGRQEAVAVADKWLVNKKKVIDALAAIETPLEEKEDAYEAEDKRIKAEKALKIEQQGIKRTSELISYGASLVDGNWVLGDLAYESVLCKNSDEDIYEGIRDQFKAVFDVKEADGVQKEADDKAAAAKLLKDQQEVAKMKEEAKKARTEARISFLESLGMLKKYSRDGVGTYWGYFDIMVNLIDIEEKESQDWEVIIAGVKEGIENAKEISKKEEKDREILKQRISELKEWRTDGTVIYNCTGVSTEVWGNVGAFVAMTEEDFNGVVLSNEEYVANRDNKKETKRLQDIENAKIEGVGKSRREMLKSINSDAGVSDFELGSIPAEQWEQDFKIATQLHNKKKKDDADKKEKERLEELGEKGRYEELVKYLKAAPIGEYRSSQYRTKVSPIRNFIDGLK